MHCNVKTPRDENTNIFIKHETTMAQMVHFFTSIRILNSKFRILNSEFRILNSEFRISKKKLCVEILFLEMPGPALQGGVKEQNMIHLEIIDFLIFNYINN